MMRSVVGSIVCDLRHIYLLHFLTKAQLIQSFPFCKLNVRAYIANHLSALNQPSSQVAVELNRHDCSSQLNEVVFGFSY
jgi:hypothetical protein